MISTEQKKIESHAFYKEAIELLCNSNIPFLLGGGFAFVHYTGITRDTKDLDVFVLQVDYPKVLSLFAEKGFTTQLYDVRWLVKVLKGDYLMDVIFNSVTGFCRVDESWFNRAQDADFLGHKVKILSPEDIIWCKSYVWNRERFDNADINHLMLKCGKTLDWKYLLYRLEPHYHLLLAELLLFQFVYPGEFLSIIPQWLFDELIRRAQEQYDLPPQQERVCRGPMIDSTQYAIDVKEWNYKSYTIITV